MNAPDTSRLAAVELISETTEIYADIDDNSTLSDQQRATLDPFVANLTNACIIAGALLYVGDAIVAQTAATQ